MPLKKLSVIAAAVIAIIVVVLITRLHAPVEYEAASVKRSKLIQTVVVTGRVASLARVDIASQITGRVSRVFVKQGDKVRKGDILIQLDSKEAAAGFEQTDAQLKEAEAKLEQLAVSERKIAAERLNEAAAALKLADATYRRTKELFDTGVASRQELDSALKGRDVAESQLKREKLLNSSLSPGGTDARMAQLRVAQFKAALAIAKEKLSQTEIRASESGYVIAKFVEQGDVVLPGSKVVTLSLSGRSELVANIDEKNLPFVSAGKKAKALADAYSDKPFDAIVSTVVPAVDPQRGTFEARFEIPSPPPFIVPDMTLSIEIEADQKNAALSVPSEALRDAAGNPWVMTVKDGMAVRKAVKTGARGEGSIEILSGLSEGEIVIISADIPKADSKVRALLKESSNK